MESENLDVKNILEVDRIRKILSETPKLLDIFDMILHIANQRVNEEKPCFRMELEENIEPELSDHESDIE